MAPERFVSSENVEGPEKLTEAYDIFSAGCVIFQLFSGDSQKLFDLTQLLNYKSGTYSPEEALATIKDPHVRELVRDMTQLDPSKRKSAETYLVDYRGKLFPTIFYDFLKTYLGKFCEHPLMAPDDIVMKLFEDRHLIRGKLADINKEDRSASVQTLTALLLSTVRRLKYCASKLKALDLIKMYSLDLDDDVVMDRIVPYLVYMMKVKYV